MKCINLWLEGRSGLPRVEVSSEGEKTFKMGGKLSALDPMQVEVPNLNVLLDRDSYLRPYEREFRRR